MNCVQSSGLESPSLTADVQRLLTLLSAADAGSSVVFVRVTGEPRGKGAGRSGTTVFGVPRCGCGRSAVPSGGRGRRVRSGPRGVRAPAGKQPRGLRGRRSRVRVMRDQGLVAAVGQAECLEGQGEVADEGMPTENSVVERRYVARCEVFSKPQGTHWVTVTALVDSDVGLELGHQVEAHRVVLQLAAGAPPRTEVAPLSGVIGVSLVQPRCEGAAYGGGKQSGVRDQPQVPKLVVAARSSVAGEARAPVTPPISPSDVVWERALIQARLPGRYGCPLPLITTPSMPTVPQAGSSQSSTVARSLVAGHSVKGAASTSRAKRSSGIARHSSLTQLGGRSGDVREGAGEVRALAGLEHDKPGAREEDGPESRGRK